MTKRENRKLKLLGCEILPEKTDIQYYKIYFPEKWYNKLLTLYKNIKGRDSVSLPSRSLNNALLALPLKIILSNELYFNKSGNINPWLITSEKIDTNMILKIVKSWCSIEFINKENIEEDLKNKIINTIESFKENDINIEEEYLDLSKNCVLGNGTSNPDKYIYNVLGCYIAEKISKDQVSLDIEDDSLYFMQHKNSLISYPPKEYKENYFSLQITFEVKTMAGYKNPIMLINTSIKRWANCEKANNLSWKNKTGVFIKYNKSIDNQENSGVNFGQERIFRDKTNKVFKWSDSVKEILEDAMLAYLPEIDNVLLNSRDYVGKNKDYTILITYNNLASFKHKVKKGISMQEKYIVNNWIESQFEFFKPIIDNNYRKVNRTCNKFDLRCKTEFSKYIEEVSKTCGELNIEVLYMNKYTPKKIIDELLNIINESKCEVKNITEKDEDVLIELHNFKINIKSIFSEDLVNDMDNFEDKVNEVKKILPKSEETRLVIVEIKDKEEYSYGKDPKYAIRKGLYKVNRVNQFILSSNINKEEEPNKEAIRNTFLELFRQLGIVVGEIKLDRLKGIPNNLNIIGFNLLSNNKNEKYDTISIPIAISFSTYDKNILVKTPLCSSWIQYKDAILRLGSENNKCKMYSKEDIQRFYVSVLNDINDEDSLLIVDTSNRLNTVLFEFQDKNMDFGNINDEFKKVRIVRVKSNKDVPDVVGLNKENTAYFISSIYEIKENIYYSLEGKTTTFQNIYESHRKLKSPTKEFKLPGTLEILTAKLNEEDDRDSFAYLTHILRNMNLTYNDWTSVPVVNHLAKSLQEVLIVKDIESTDE